MWYTDSLIGDFGLKQLAVEVNGKPTILEYVGSEMDEDAIWLYYQIEKVKKVKSMKVTNTIFLDRFDNQENFVNLQLPGERTSFRLNHRTQTATFPKKDR
jgi:hypothetical protein